MRGYIVGNAFFLSHIPRLSVATLPLAAARRSANWSYRFVCVSFTGSAIATMRASRAGVTEAVRMQVLWTCLKARTFSPPGEVFSLL